MRFDIFQSQYGTLFHHVAQVTCKRQFRSFAAAHTRLDKQNFAAYSSPRQSGNHASIFVALVFVSVEQRFAKQRLYVGRLDAAVGKRHLAVFAL